MITSSRTWAVKPLRLCAAVRLNGRQFSKAHPNAGSKTFFQCLNTDRLKAVMANAEPSVAQAQRGHKFQFDHFGYFVTDRADHVAGS